ncbi:MAG: hypothetical protein E6Q41_04555 [Cyclobacteriaceae bacterium]|nr:MAG: hypothetical protein E6Q41_04555 [Cyclobacteriaceae bacterium]
MKRVFAIFLMLLFLLNVLGYYGVLEGLQLKNKQTLQALFDSDEYERQHEVTIKVPLTVPYATDSKEYTRVDGEFEHQGEIYRMVKQKLQSDTLYIVCVKDETSRDIKQALAEYVKSFTDKPASEKSQSKTLQNLIKDYIATSTALQPIQSGWSYAVPQGELVVSYPAWTSKSTSPPPKA